MFTLEIRGFISDRYVCIKNEGSRIIATAFMTAKVSLLNNSRIPIGHEDERTIAMTLAA